MNLSCEFSVFSDFWISCRQKIFYVDFETTTIEDNEYTQILNYNKRIPDDKLEMNSNLILYMIGIGYVTYVFFQ